MNINDKKINFLLITSVIFLLFSFIQCSKYDYVTCQSVLKLQNVNTGARLHSHDVKYGSGSGQQSVTAVKTADDTNSYWQVKPKFNGKCDRGVPIKCGETIRIHHLSTRKNLHSHYFQSPLSSNQEVSAFGDNGEGDESDNWTVECDDTLWRRDDHVRFKHTATNKYLHITGDTFGRPIHGQLEVSASQYANSYNLWQVNEGVFIKPSLQANSYAHSEL